MAEARGAAAQDSAGAAGDTSHQRVLEQIADQATSRDRASQSDTVTGQDVGHDERLRSSGADHSEANFRNEKRTYDVHQSVDLEGWNFARRQEIIEAERRRTWDDREQQQRLRFAEAEHSQRLRHADFQVTALAAVTKELVETIADRTAAEVCKRIGGK